MILNAWLARYDDSSIQRNWNSLKTTVFKVGTSESQLRVSTTYRYISVDTFVCLFYLLHMLHRFLEKLICFFVDIYLLYLQRYMIYASFQPKLDINTHTHTLEHTLHLLVFSSSRFWHRCWFIIFTSFTSQGGERVTMEKFSSSLRADERWNLLKHLRLHGSLLFFWGVWEVCILFWVFIPWKGMKGGVFFCLCCGAIDGWMILDGLLGNCPPKRKKVSVLSKWHIPFHKMEVWEGKNFRILRKNIRDSEIFSNVSPSCIYLPEIVYIVLHLLLLWDGIFGGETNIICL